MMIKAIALLIGFVGLISVGVSAQDKVVLVDISHEDRAAYPKLSPDIFKKYHDVVENQLGAKLIINEGHAIDSKMLEGADVLILLSSLNSKAQKGIVQPVKSILL